MTYIPNQLTTKLRGVCREHLCHWMHGPSVYLALLFAHA